MKLKKIMKPDPVTLQPDQTVQEAVGFFSQHRLDCTPVTDENGYLKGVLSIYQIIDFINQNGNLSDPVQKIMYDHVRSGHPNDDVEEYQDPRLEFLPVVDENRVVGILTHREMVDAFFKSYKRISTQLEAIINSTHNLIVTVDEKGLMRVFNKANLEFFGLTAQEVIGMDVRDLVPTSGLPEVVQSGKAQPVQKVMLKDHWFISNRSPIRINGKIIGAVAVLQDISEFENIARELEHYKNLNKELDTIIDSSYDGLHIADGNGVTLRVNDAFLRSSGLDRDDIEGRNMEDVEKEGLVSCSATNLVLRRKEPLTITQESKNGNILLTTSIPVYDQDGSIYRIVSNVRDITELEKLKQKIEEVESLKLHYERQLRTLRLKYIGSDKIIAKSEKMKNLMEMVIRLAQYNSTILITGESGTGKELIAETIHNNSNREKGPFIKVNCGAIPENLLESELFGYDYGAFTGAKKGGRTGYFQMANGGTIFLDEIGDLPFNLQVKLLRVLQNKEIIRVGGEKALSIDVHVITGTNRNLLELVQKKEFREDLYYRLNVVPIHVPPLRDRKEDVPPLVTHFANLFNKKHNQHKNISPEVVEYFMAYDWPGNVRELENMIERLFVTTSKDTITWEDLPQNLIKSKLDNKQIIVSDIIPLLEAREIVEKQILEKAYVKYQSTRQMAKVLKVTAATIVRKAAKYGIKR